MFVGRSSGSIDLKAGGLMFVSVLCYSSLSLAIALTHGGESPYLFVTWWRVGMVLGIGLYLSLRYRFLFFSPEVWARVRSRLGSWHMRLTLLAYLDITLFVLSTTLISITAATILIQVTTIFFVLFMHRLDENQSYRKMSLNTVFLMALGVVGFGFVIVSESGTDGIFRGGLSISLLGGTALALLAAFVGAFNAYTFSLGRMLASEHDGAVVSVGRTGGGGGEELRVFYVLLCSWVVNIAAVGVNGLMAVGDIYLLKGHGGLPLDMIVLSAVWGAVPFTVAGILNRQANLMTSNLGVNAISYARPVFAIALLLLFAEMGLDLAGVSIARVDFFLIGVVGIVSVNILINFKAERLVGFKALVLALCACGSFVYLRDAGDPYLVWKVADAGYFEALALSATMFTLILSFRVSRLAARTHAEDELALRLFRELSALSRQGVVASEVCGEVLRIDRSQGEDLEDAYDRARYWVLEAASRAGGRELERLTLVESDLDSLVHSRQQDINFGELCVLFIFCSITVGLALSARPDAGGFIAFITEVFTILFSSVVIFLTVNVLDLQRHRRESVLYERTGLPASWGELGPGEFTESLHGRYGVVFQWAVQRTAEQWISVVAGASIVCAYVWLLGYKWLGWGGGL